VMRQSQISKKLPGLGNGKQRNLRQGAEDCGFGRRSHFGGGALRIRSTLLRSAQDKFADCGRFLSIRYPVSAIRYLVVERRGLKAAAVAIRTGGVSPIAAEQDAHMH